MLFPTHGVPMEIHPADGRFGSPIRGNIHELVDFDEVPDFVSHDAKANGNGKENWVSPRIRDSRMRQAVSDTAGSLILA